MIKTVAVDTNALLDYCLKRQPGFKKIQQLIKDSLNKKSKIFIPDIVFPEVEWVLRSFYKQPKDFTINFLEELLLMEETTAENKLDLEIALNMFQHSNIKFTDAIILAQIFRIKPDEFLTFDEDLQKFYTNKPPATMEWE